MADHDNDNDKHPIQQAWDTDRALHRRMMTLIARDGKLRIMAIKAVEIGVGWGLAAAAVCGIGGVLGAHIAFVPALAIVAGICAVGYVGWRTMGVLARIADALRKNETNARRNIWKEEKNKSLWRRILGL